MCEILYFFFVFGIWSRFAIGSLFESRVVRRSRKECKINWNVQYQIDRLIDGLIVGCVSNFKFYCKDAKMNV